MLAYLAEVKCLHHGSDILKAFAKGTGKKAHCKKQEMSLVGPGDERRLSFRQPCRGDVGRVVLLGLGESRLPYLCLVVRGDRAFLYTGIWG